MLLYASLSWVIAVACLTSFFHFTILDESLKLAEKFFRFILLKSLSQSLFWRKRQTTFSWYLSLKRASDIPIKHKKFRFSQTRKRSADDCFQQQKEFFKYSKFDRREFMKLEKKNIFYSWRFFETTAATVNAAPTPEPSSATWRWN